MKVNLKVKGEKEFYQIFKDFPESNKKAVENTLNTCAGMARKNYVKQIDAQFIQRNNFTKRSIVYDRVKSPVINSMESTVGALRRASYMEIQEDGGDKSKKGDSYALASTATRGGSDRNLIPKKDYISKVMRGIDEWKPKLRRSRKANAVAQAYVASKTGQFIVRDKKIFAVTSFSKLSRNKPQFETKLLYNLRKEKIHIKGRHFLERAIERPSRELENIYVYNIKKFWHKEK